MALNSNEEMKRFSFKGVGTRVDLMTQLGDINPHGGTIGPWYRKENEPIEDETAPNHPAGYITQPDLIDAVNTALILQKPLLLTGNPGTGKSELAERIAWEFNLGSVLRFEVQSLSEANDLFYRYDFIGHMAGANMTKLREPQDLAGSQSASNAQWFDPDALAHRFITFGPLGKAILRSDPTKHWDLYKMAYPLDININPCARPSVVLIDEIDKASRDFPNDLLNGIDKLEFRIKELNNDQVLGVPYNAGSLRPIVVITSNSERDLPGPFLRRCIYFHIPDPDRERMRNIIRSRVFPETLGMEANPNWSYAGELPPLYEHLLEFFMEYRRNDEHPRIYNPGTSELLDWSTALRRSNVNQDDGIGAEVNRVAVEKAVSAATKQRDDRQEILNALQEKVDKSRERQRSE